MNTKTIFSLFFFTLFGTGFLTAQSARQRYIDTYDVTAMREMKQYGIPASVTLAQGILESGDGNSSLAKKSNNHFGIKCHGDWKGQKVYHDDDEKGECFRKYKDPDQSFRDHSLFLSGRSRYAFLFELKPNDYKGWAKGLQKAGYATSKSYSKRLIAIIEDNDLQRFDEKVLNGTEDWLSGTIVLVSGNNLKYITLDDYQSLEDISREFDVSMEKLLAYNDLRWDSEVEKNARIYIQKKKKKGSTKYYTVKAGDTMYSISQKMGITLASLYSRNKMNMGAQPAARKKIRLRGKGG